MPAHIPAPQLPLHHTITDLIRRKNRCHQGRKQLSFNARQNISLPKGPCYYIQQPTSIQLNNTIASITPFICVTSAVKANISPHKAMHYNGLFTLPRRDTGRLRLEQSEHKTVYVSHSQPNVPRDEMTFMLSISKAEGMWPLGGQILWCKITVGSQVPWKIYIYLVYIQISTDQRSGEIFRTTHNTLNAFKRRLHLDRQKQLLSTLTFDPSVHHRSLWHGLCSPFPRAIPQTYWFTDQ